MPSSEHETAALGRWAAETDQMSAGVTERASAASLERRLRHQALAARTVGVSYRAAVESADRHLQVSDDERREITDGWREWAVATLDRYAADLRALEDQARSSPDDVDGALEACRAELNEAYRIVRETIP